MAKKLSSYQRRLRDIEYLEQCIEELETIIEELVKKLKKKDKNLSLPLTLGIDKGDFITPYNNGDFLYKLVLIEWDKEASDERHIR